VFRHIEGFKAEYGDMSLLVAHDFAEWHVIIIKHPTILIQGSRQFSEDKAREHARQVADSYIRDEKQENVPGLPNELTWTPLQPGDWLSWRP
jgi:hypothetical protein